MTRIWQWLWGLAFVALLIAAVYFSLRPSPVMAKVPLVPTWWAKWLDGHDVVRGS